MTFEYFPCVYSGARFDCSQTTVFYSDVRNPFGVSVFEDHIYWSTQEKGEVFRQDKFGRGEKTKLLTAGPWLTQVSVYQQQRYNSVTSTVHTQIAQIQHTVLFQ